MKPELKILRRLIVIQICLFGVNGDVTKTTATVVNCDDTECMKPTSRFIVRRINVHQGFETTKNIFHNWHLKPSKRILSAIWKWDFRCQNQAKVGKCNNKELRFYYDVQADKCLQFTFTGCDGNLNNFKTQVECDRRCKGAASMSLYITEPESYCTLQPNAGTCLDLFTRFYYDINENKCKKFVFGGCGGNENNFNSEAKCIKTCSNVIRSGKRIKSSDSDDSSGSDGSDGTYDSLS